MQYHSVFPRLKKIGLSAAAFLSVSYPALAQDEKPNILWITSEDNSADYMGCYGNEQATTPNIDQLAEEGITYNNAFANVPVSAPARFTLITGMYASNCGTQHMRSNYEIPGKFKFFPTYLRNAGYYCTNNAKEDYNLDEEMWDTKVSNAWNESSGDAHYKNRESGQPFFAVFNTGLSHEHKIHYHLIKEEGEFEHSPENLDIAPYHPDLPVIRKCYAQYYDYVSRMDEKVGEILDELKKRGVAKNTIVFYYGDHGGVLPRSKRYMFESGTRVPMIVHFPEKYQDMAPAEPGARTDRLVSFIDLAPTVLSLAGIDIPGNMQGSAFLGNQKTDDPEYVHFFRGRMDERYDMMRGVRTKKYRYIRNYMPHRIYGQHLWYLWRSPSTRAWEDAYNSGECNAVQSRFWQTKPAEELYNVEKDPHNVNNLANDPEYADVLKRLRKENKRWTRKNRGAGFMPEGMMVERAGQQTIYKMTHSESFPSDKIISAAELASNGNIDNLSRLEKMLSSSEPAVRYWAATGYAIIAKKTDAKIPDDAIKKLKSLLEDNYEDTRIAAAEALITMGRHTKNSLNVLVNNMKNGSNKWVRLHAINALEALGEKAKPVEKDIMNIRTGDRSGYFRRAYNNLVKDLKPGWADYIIW